MRIFFIGSNVLPIELPASAGSSGGYPLAGTEFYPAVQPKTGNANKGDCSCGHVSFVVLPLARKCETARKSDRKSHGADGPGDALSGKLSARNQVLARNGGLIEWSFEGYSLKVAQKMIEKQLITKALEFTGGNRTRAAELLEISHPSLLTKMKAYNILL